MTPWTGAVARGLGVALAVAVPAALAAQVVDALDDASDPPAAVLLFAPVVLAGAFAGGLVAGRSRPPRPLLAGAAAGLLALALVQAIGVVRRSVAGEDVAWSAVVVTAVAGPVLGAVGAALGHRGAGRKRP